MDPIREKIGRWSLERVQFVLNHLEDFVTETDSIGQQMATFSSQTGLNQIASLSVPPDEKGQTSVAVLQQLVPFFEAGFLIQKLSAAADSAWWVTDIFSRGQIFNLELKDQVRAEELMVSISPLQIVRAPTEKILGKLGLPFLQPKVDSSGYLIRPTPTVALLLISALSPLWIEDHMKQAQRLINNAFCE